MAANVLVRDDDTTSIVDFAYGSAGAPPERLARDRVELLVTTAVVVGNDRAPPRRTVPSAATAWPSCCRSSVWRCRRWRGPSTAVNCSPICASKGRAETRSPAHRAAPRRGARSSWPRRRSSASTPSLQFARRPLGDVAGRAVGVGQVAAPRHRSPSSPAISLQGAVAARSSTVPSSPSSSRQLHRPHRRHAGNDGTRHPFLPEAGQKVAVAAAWAC